MPQSTSNPYPAKHARRWTALIVIGVAVLVYAGAYLWLSRAGFSRADAHDTEGFYFVEVDSAETFRAHRTIAYVFYPAILVERVLGTGREPANERCGGLNERP